MDTVAIDVLTFNRLFEEAQNGNIQSKLALSKMYLSPEFPLFSVEKSKSLLNSVVEHDRKTFLDYIDHIILTKNKELYDYAISLFELYPDIYKDNCELQLQYNLRKSNIATFYPLVSNDLKTFRIREKWYQDYAHTIKCKQEHNESINVCIFSSIQYLKYGLVTLHSLCKNTKRKCNIFILSWEEYGPDEFKKISFLENQYSIKIKYINIKKYAGNVRLSDPSYPYEPMVVHYLNEILPENIDKILCLECDTLIDEDISSMYDIDLNGYVLASCHPTYDEGFAHMYTAGAILFNIKKLRSIKMNYEYYMNLALCLGTYKTTEKIVNNEFYGRCLLVDSYRYNHCSRTRIDFGTYYTPVKPVIYHYWTNLLFGSKPWKHYIADYNRTDFIIEGKQCTIEKEIMQLHKLWWDYAKETPFFYEFKNEAIQL